MVSSVVLLSVVSTGPVVLVPGSVLVLPVVAAPVLELPVAIGSVIVVAAGLYALSLERKPA